MYIQKESEGKNVKGYLWANKFVMHESTFYSFLLYWHNGKQISVYRFSIKDLKIDKKLLIGTFHFDGNLAKASFYMISHNFCLFDCESFQAAILASPKQCIKTTFATSY